jgi:hypothetical protein
MGVHRFRDPALVEEFETEPLRLDVAVEHTYAVDCRPGALTFAVDGRTVRELGQAPDYPVQLMIVVFDFPGRHRDPDPEPPQMAVRRVTGGRKATAPPRSCRPSTGRRLEEDRQHARGVRLAGRELA